MTLSKNKLLIVLITMTYRNQRRYDGVDCEGNELETVKIVVLSKIPTDKRED